MPGDVVVIIDRVSTKQDILYIQGPPGLGPWGPGLSENWSTETKNGREAPTSSGAVGLSTLISYYVEKG